MLADTMREAPERLDLRRLPPRFLEARKRICTAIAKAQADAISEAAIAAVLVSETVPMLTRVYGPHGAAGILTLMADSISPPAASPFTEPEATDDRPSETTPSQTSCHGPFGLSWSRKNDVDEPHSQQPGRNAGRSDRQRHERGEHRRRPHPRWRCEPVEN
ncbi:MAG TPA: hypothetical protein VNQ56_01705 [Pseudolabrys sp.]|nr:hypothetical protein [Pseudolabrys sp.]